jgi:two-component system, NarL family, nitrate/nitrite response regulator NarL
MFRHPSRLFARERLGNMEDQLRLLIVGSSRFVNDAIAEQVKAQPNLNSSVLTTTAPEDLFTETFDCAFDLILIDANLCVPSLVDLLRNVRAVFDEAKIIVLGVDQKEVLGIIEGGAHGYVLKEQSFGEVIKMIEALENNQTFCSSQIAISVFNKISELSRVREEDGEKLTQREQQILKLIAAGFSNKDISRQLQITLCTVKNHVHNILSKLQVHRRQDAIQCALRNRLIQQLNYVLLVATLVVDRYESFG